MSESNVVEYEPKQERAALPTATNPSALLQLAVEKDMDLEKLEKLMDLNDRYMADQARRAYADAFAKFQSMVPVIPKTKDAHNSKYAALGDIAYTIRESLKDCGLSYRFEIGHDGERITVTCIVTHRDGHSERTSMSGLADTSGSKNPIQANASTVSYLQRYTLIGALGLTTADEDMDGRLSGETITDEQAKSLKKRLADTESDVKRFCAALKIADIDSMPAGKYSQADTMLKQKEANRDNKK